MALWFKLRINNEEIGLFTAQRRESLAELADSEKIGTYDVEITDQLGNVKRFVVRHPYNDGAWALVERSLIEAFPGPALQWATTAIGEDPT